MNNIKIEICFLSTSSMSRNKISEMVENYFVAYNEEGKRELLGDSHNANDLDDLYRFVCYKLKLDRVNKRVFIKEFKKTVKELEKSLDKLIIPISNTVSVFGEVTKNNPVFEPKHYEYKKFIPVKFFGNIDNLILSPNKNIISINNAVYFDTRVVVGDFNTLKNRDEIYVHKLETGVYNIYKIFDNDKLRYICLVHSSKDFYALNWESAFAFCTDRSDKAAMYVCKPDYSLSKKDIPTNDYLIHTDGNFFAVKVNNTRDKEDESNKLAQVYVAYDKEFDRGVVGLVFEVGGRENGVKQTLYDFL